MIIELRGQQEEPRTLISLEVEHRQLWLMMPTKMNSGTKRLKQEILVETINIHLQQETAEEELESQELLEDKDHVIDIYFTFLQLHILSKTH